MFEPTADQRALSEVARQFADDVIAPHAVEWDRTKHFPVDVFAQAGELGMGGMYIREDVGGSGLSRLDAAIIIEALATGCPSIASYVSIHNMTAWMIDAHGSPELRRKYLPRMCTMASLGSYCLTEPGAGSDAAAVSSTAKVDGDHYVLNGVKQFISGAGASDIYVIMVRTGGPGAKNLSAFVVEKDTQGLSFGPNESKMGWNAQPTRQVIMQDVRIPASQMLGSPGDGFRIAMSGLNGGRINIGASSLGGAQSALEKSLTYMAERSVFGETLNQIQALQFYVADMATKLEAARLLLWRAASALDAKDAAAVQLCAMAKKFATDTGFEVANTALQIHGGYGYLAEYGIEKIVRDLRVHQILEGTNEIMQVIISRSLIKK
ncbi:acyl-CoA dehydrogenase [Nakamurella antarctica]|uniref:Acyl-CoA dehydrogenase n=1 Tax=Nakamurella antarctica TaxID=1902245 RepID=A0A3G8ZZL5_9ACTN|nr:acyl-CoA dehydrogenase [Nakamurella antarctica]